MHLRGRVHVLFGILLLASASWAQETTRISGNPLGFEAESGGRIEGIGTDGRFVAFHSNALLDAADSGPLYDVFVRDMETGATERVSRGPGGGRANGDSFVSAMSPDGRFVAFHSGATNLGPVDTNEAADVYVVDRLSGGIELASVSSAGVQGDAQSVYPRISDDGRYVVFLSSATNLVANDTNGVDDVFVRDLTSGTTVRVNVSASGEQANVEARVPTISGDGRFVAFWSVADNLAPNAPGLATFVTEWATGEIEAAPKDSGDDCVELSRDGRYVAVDSQLGVEVFDRDTRTYEPAAVAVDGSAPNGSTFGCSLSADGRRVAFESSATDLLDPEPPSGTHVYLRDLDELRTWIADLDVDGLPTEETVDDVRLSPDGEIVGFSAWGDGITPEDTNGVVDAFVRGAHSEIVGLRHVRVHPATHRLTWDAHGSADARYRVYRGNLSNLAAIGYDHEPLESGCDLDATELAVMDLEDGSDAYYVVTFALPGGEGPAGASTAGAPRASIAECP